MAVESNFLSVTLGQCLGAAGWQLPGDEGSRTEAPDEVFGQNTRERAT